ncbi:putative PPE family protein PPE42 [Mycobacterium simulans]|uniref:Putative PPE family protein PPE42 n=1 Tax=Mycobacterium simulans TaxID=627089 RepID=A0A7Z7IPD6_9MYCO|nr:PPE family protein [Mycobacterium simulans]SOJ57345.1 putative PPE family protein PPE42 [Mycobacterium simulans]
MANFALLPPEINSALMFTGAGPGPLLEAAVAWDGLSFELGSAASSFGSITSSLATQAWQGPAAAAMVAAAAPYASWLDAAATRAAGAAGQARAVAGVFEAARTAMVQPIAVAANRSQIVSLVLSNLFGQNAPAIAGAFCPNRFDSTSDTI